MRWKEGAPPHPGVLATAVQKVGYQAQPIAASKDGVAHHSRAGGWQMVLVAGLVCTGLLMAGEWVFRLENAVWWPWVSLLLASVVQFGPGLQFYRGAWNQLKAGASNMDTLVALGSTTAYVYSLWAMLGGLGGPLSTQPLLP